jgi:hypothetical protein
LSTHRWLWEHNLHAERALEQPEEARRTLKWPIPQSANRVGPEQGRGRINALSRVFAGYKLYRTWLADLGSSIPLQEVRKVGVEHIGTG